MRLRGLGIVAAIALLYAGPLLAGLIGAGWPAIPVLALIFQLWLIVMRPGTPLAAMALQLPVQAVLVALLWGLGLLLARLVALPDLSLAWPLALSALSIPLARAVLPPSSDRMDAFLDEALERLNAMPTPPEPDADETRASPRLQARIDTAIAALDAMGDRLDSAQIDRVIEAFPDPAEARDLSDALRALPDRGPVHLLAGVYLALRFDLIEWRNYDDLPACAATDALSLQDPDLSRDTARRLLALIDRLGSQAIHVTLPSDGELLDHARHFAQTGREDVAHDLRAVVKARGLAQVNYDEETRLDDD